MDSFNHRRIVNELCETLHNSLLKNVDAFPQNWSGIEIRQYIIDYAKCNLVVPMNKKRKREYNNDIVINNLL